MKNLFLILIVLLVTSGCRNELIHYYESENANSIEDKEIKDEVMSIYCYDGFKAAYERMNVSLDFNLEEVYSIDSLDVKVKFDNNSYLTPIEFVKIGKRHKRPESYGKKVNIQKIISISEIPFYTQYIGNDKIVTNYVFRFNGPKSYHPDSLTLEINASLSNENDTIKYDRELTLYPNTVVFYD